MSGSHLNMTVKIGHFLGFRKFVSVLVIIFWEKVNDRGIHTAHLGFIKKTSPLEGYTRKEIKEYVCMEKCC
jgi:hypothetical protein